MVSGGEDLPSARPESPAALTTPKLLACDLDGTLIVEGNRLSERTAAAVDALVDAGVVVVAATGRPWQLTLDLAREHRLLPLAVCSNGAALVEVESGTIEAAGLEDTVLGLVERARDVAPGIRFAVERVDALRFEDGFMDVVPDAVFVGSVGPVEDAIGDGVVKLIARCPGMEAGVLAALLDHEVLGGAAEPWHGTGEWVELLPVGVSKASGLAWLCERLGVDRHEVVAVGDGWNDVAMVEWAGLGVAVGEACPELVEVADHVVPPAAAGGVDDLLETLLG